MKKLWIVLVNRGGARIMEHERPSRKLVPIVEFLNPEGHPIEHDEEVDQRRAEERTPEVITFRKSNEVPSVVGLTGPSRENEIRAFCKEVGAYLQKHLLSGKFDQILLAAEPQVLGVLRSVLPDQVSDCIVATIDKDLVSLSPSQIRPSLEKVDRPGIF